MANNSKKYVSLSKLSTFLDNLKNNFADTTHEHTMSDITDYKVDTELSSTSTNPVQNKVLDAEFEAISDGMGALETAIDNKADASHNHDDRYYTETEIDSKLNGKSDIGHTHSDYVPTSRKVNGKALNANITLSASDVGADASGSADIALDSAKSYTDDAIEALGDTYYTETEIDSQVATLNTAISGKADSSHTHDDRYYTETEVNDKLAEKADSGHTHTISNVTNLQNSLDAKVPTSRKVNGKALTTDITLSASDVGASESGHNHDTKYDTKGAAAAVQTNLDTVNDELDTHTSNTDIHVTTANKTNWNTAYTHSQSTHARTDATKVADSTTNGNILINGTETNVYSHPNSGVTAGTYKSVTVNAQGHITGGTNPTTLAGYGITDAESKGAASNALADAKEYTDTVASGKADTSHNHDSKYDAKGAASSALASAKEYADSAATTAANTVKNDLLNGAGTAYDTLKELGDLIDDNADAIDALETVAAGKADKTHSHAIADVSGLQTALDGKAASSHGTHVSYSTTAPVMDGTASAGSASTVARSDHKHPTDTSRASKTEFDTHTANTTAHITSTERSNWNAAKTHADSAHAPSNAEKNQNAFSNITVGSTTVAADTATDTVTFVGSNVTITPDATNDKITFAVADGSTSAKGIVQLTNSTSSTSTTTAATPSSVKSAYDLANTAKTAAATAQTTADSKADENHTHNYAASSSAGGAATSANKLNTDAGSATQPVYFANGIPVKTTYTLGKSVPSDAKFTDTTYSKATTTSNGLMSLEDKTKLDYTNIGYGTCTTAAATAAKVITISGNTQWVLAAGSLISVFFSNTNTAESPTLNVNGTGAKNIYYGASQITTSSLGYGGTADRMMNFVYDGTQYRFIGWGYDSNTTYTNVKLGQGYATCSTAAATAAKVGTLSSYTLVTGGIVSVKFTYDVPANATLNINSKGAKNIYYRGDKITADVIKAGDVATFIYSTYYHLISIDRWQNDITNIQTALNTKQAIITGGASTIASSDLTASRALVSDSSGKVSVSAVTSTELGYLDGVTSAIQTQLDGKAKTSDLGFVRIVTCTSSDGVTYTGTTDGVTALTAGLTIVFTSSKTSASKTPTLNLNSLGAKNIKRRLSHLSTSTQEGYSTTWLYANKPYLLVYDGTQWVVDGLTKPSAADLYGTVPADKLPSASGSAAGITIVYPADSCTTFSSDSGTVTPAAVQKGAKMFAITRPSTSTTNAVTRYSNTTGDVKDSKITIEDVTNSRDTSKKANVLVIPAEGNKKMVYGYCTDQVDGTSFIGGVFDASATSYPYAAGLAIGGTSGNLLWKGKQVATTDMIPTSLKNPYALTFTGGATGTYDGSAAKTVNIPTASSVAEEVVVLLKSSGDVVVGAVDSDKNILLAGDLADGVYTLKYQNSDGTTTTIGTLKAGAGYKDVAEGGTWLINKRINSSFQLVDANGYAVFVSQDITGLTEPSQVHIKFGSTINLLANNMKEVWIAPTGAYQSYDYDSYKGSKNVTKDANGDWTYTIAYTLASEDSTGAGNGTYRFGQSVSYAYSGIKKIGFSLQLSSSAITNADLPTVNMAINELIAR